MGKMMTMTDNGKDLKKKKKVVQNYKPLEVI